MKNILCILLVFSNSVIAQTSAGEYYKSGKSKLDESKYFEAIDYFTQAIETDPDFEQAWCLRGEAHHALGEYEKAISDFNHVINRKKTIDEKSTEIFMNRGISKIEIRDFEGAEEDLNTAIELDPLSSDSYFTRSRLKFLILKDKNEAIKDLDIAIRINPDNPDYYVRRAEYKAYLAKYGFDDDAVLASAIRDMSFAIYLEPDNYDFYQMRSQFNKKRGDPLAAVEDYNRMIELRPDMDEAYSERGIIKMQYDDYESAIEDFTCAIELNPLKEDNYRFRGLCKHNQQDYEGAITDYSNSIKLLYGEYEITADKVQIRRILADTYLKRGAAATSHGNSLDACTDFRRAYELGSRKGLNYMRKYCGL